MGSSLKSSRLGGRLSSPSEGAMKRRIAKKILCYVIRGLPRMTKSQRVRERRCNWNKRTVGRAYERLGREA